MASWIESRPEAKTDKYWLTEGHVARSHGKRILRVMLLLMLLLLLLLFVDIKLLLEVSYFIHSSLLKLLGDKEVVEYQCDEDDEAELDCFSVNPFRDRHPGAQAGQHESSGLAIRQCFLYRYCYIKTRTTKTQRTFRESYTGLCSPRFGNISWTKARNVYFVSKLPRLSSNMYIFILYCTLFTLAGASGYGMFLKSDTLKSNIFYSRVARARTLYSTYYEQIQLLWIWSLFN